MGIKLDRLDYEWYVPAYDGNRARAEAGEDPDPLLVEIRSPGYGELRKLALAGHTGLAADHQRYFLDHVREIRGLQIDGTAVTTGMRLYELAEQDQIGPALLTELFQAIDDRARLEAGLKKNWKSPSGS